MSYNSAITSNVCNYKMSNERPCGRIIFEGDSCIFHSKKIDGKKNKFDELFQEELKRQMQEDDIFDFRGFIFPNTISFEDFKFEKNTVFSEAEFHGERTIFRRAKFCGDKTEFAYAKITGDYIIFDGAIFSGKKSDFSLVDFECNEKISFVGVHFLKGQLDFRGTKFSGKIIDFRDIYFSTEKTDFLGTHFFGEKLDFHAARFSGKEVNFKDAEFSGKQLNENIEIDLAYAYFYNVFNLFESLEKKKKYFKSFRKKKYSFKEFNFLLGDMTAIRYPIINRMAKDACFMKDYKNQHPIIYRIWNITSKCGQSITLWFLWSLLFTILFAVFYYFIYQINKSTFNIEVKDNSLLTFINYSVAIFTSLGFREVVSQNNGWLKILVILESLLGYIMLGGLISIFSNKLARRS